MEVYRLEYEFESARYDPKIERMYGPFPSKSSEIPLFLNAVSQDALIEGAVVEINVTTPEGKTTAPTSS